MWRSSQILRKAFSCSLIKRLFIQSIVLFYATSAAIRWIIKIITNVDGKLQAFFFHPKCKECKFLKSKTSINQNLFTWKIVEIVNERLRCRRAAKINKNEGKKLIEINVREYLFLSFLHAFFPFLNQNEKKNHENMFEKPHIRYKSNEEPKKTKLIFNKINSLCIVKSREHKKWRWKNGFRHRKNFDSFFLLLFQCLRPQTMDPISGVSCFNQTEMCEMPVHRLWRITFFSLPFMITIAVNNLNRWNGWI